MWSSFRVTYNLKYYTAEENIINNDNEVKMIRNCCRVYRRMATLRYWVVKKMYRLHREYFLKGHTGQQKRLLIHLEVFIPIGYRFINKKFIYHKCPFPRLNRGDTTGIDTNLPNIFHIVFHLPDNNLAESFENEL